MSDLHAGGLGVILALVGAYGAGGLVGALSNAVPRWTSWVWLALVVVAGIQGITGLILAATGSGPAGFTHWIYGGALILLALVGNGLALAATRRRRGPLVAGTAVILAILALRLAQTG